MSWVRETLAPVSQVAPGTEVSPDVASALSACIVGLELFRPPSYETYNPGDFVRKTMTASAPENVTVNVEPVADCVGDVELIGRCVRLLLSNAELGPESDIVVELFEQDEAYGKEKIPCIAIGFDGLGRIPDILSINGFILLSFDEFGARWTVATRGGRIDRTANGLLLRLKGVRVIPEISDEFEPARKCLTDAQATSSPTIAVEAADGALSLLDGPDRPAESADVKALISEVQAESQPILEAKGITTTILYTSPLPPLAVRRNRLRTFFLNLLDYALASMPSGRSISLMCGYDADRREMEIVADVEGVAPGRAPALYAASLRRAVVDAHGGVFDWTIKGNVTSISATIPDEIGRALEEWIPGLEVFSDRSKQMLRLLKSAPHGLPEEVLLAGVLEDELERWLLPNLSEPPAVNAAHEITVEALSKGFSAERRKKVLEQIRKGKPKKEICARSYAAEILHAFRSQDRYRRAIGAERLSAEEIEMLAVDLTQPSPPFVECLRRIAHARSVT